MTVPTSRADVLRLIRGDDPAEREELVASLPEAVRSWSDAEVDLLGADLVALLTGAEPTVVQSFAALALVDVARRGVWSTAWTEPVLHWWTRAEDLRAFDPVEGWVHAVAHGADLVGELVLRGHLAPGRALGACGRRLIAPTEFAFVEDEDDRVALALVRALSRVTEPVESTAWLHRVGGYVLSPQPVPADPSRGNCLRTLRSLLTILDVPRPAAGVGGPVPQAEEVREAVLAVLAAATPRLWDEP